MGGQGPPQPVRFQSFTPWRVPAGSASRDTASCTPATPGGRSYSTQCTHVILGALGSGASGSSTTRASDFVPAGTPVHASGGEASPPSQVYWIGISPPSWNAAERRT